MLGNLDVYALENPEELRLVHRDLTMMHMTVDRWPNILKATSDLEGLWNTVTRAGRDAVLVAQHRLESDPVMVWEVLDL